MSKKSPPKPLAVLGHRNRLVGYARVSTADQDVQMQVAALRRAGVLDDNMHFETVSGVKKRRPKRDLALMDARDGDVFVVYKLDRLGRSFRELLEIVDGLTQRGVGFRSLTEGFDTTTPAGRFMFHMLGALAEFERGLIAEGLGVEITRGRQSNTHRQWEIKSGPREYRAVCYWCAGQLRMTWLVETYVKVAQGTSHWRRIEGREIIDAVREFENRFAELHQ